MGMSDAANAADAANPARASGWSTLSADSRKANDRKERGANRERRGRSAERGYTRIFITLGRKDRIAPTKLIDLINHHTKGKHIEVGRIDLMQNFSFFEVIEPQADEVIQALNGIRMKGRIINVEAADENKGNSDKAGKKRHPDREARRKEERPKPHRKDRAGRKEKDYPIQAPRKKDDWKQFFVRDEGKRKKRK